MSIDYQAKYLSFYIIITLITFIAFTGTRYSTLMQASEKKKITLWYFWRVDALPVTTITMSETKPQTTSAYNKYYFPPDCCM